MMAANNTPGKGAPPPPPRRRKSQSALPLPKTLPKTLLKTESSPPSSVPPSRHQTPDNGDPDLGQTIRCTTSPLPPKSEPPGVGPLETEPPAPANRSAELPSSDEITNRLFEDLPRDGDGILRLEDDADNGQTLIPASTTTGRTANDEEIISLCQSELARDPDQTRTARLYDAIARACADPVQGLRNFRRALEAMPDHMPSIRGARALLVAHAQAAHGDGSSSDVVRDHAKDAAQLFDAEIRLSEDPRDKARLYNEKGRTLEDYANDRTAASRCYRLAAELDSTCLTYHKAYEQAMRQEKAWAALCEAQEGTIGAMHGDDNHRAALLMERARLLETRLDKTSQASELYVQAYRLDKGASGAIEALKRLFNEQERWRDFNEVMQRQAVLATDPAAKALALFQIGRTHNERLGNRDEAMKWLACAMTASPKEILVLDALAQLYERSGNHRDLVAVLAHRIDTLCQKRDRLEMLHRVGELSEKKIDDLDGARRWYEAALTIDPCYEPAMAALDRLYEQAHAWEALVAMLMAAIEVAQDSDRRATWHGRVAQVLERRLGRLDEAIHHHGRALALSPAHQISFKALARLYAVSGRHRELIDLYERGIDHGQGPEHVVAYLFKMGAIYEDNLGDLGQAIHCFRRIVDLDSHNRGAILALQRTAERADRHDELIAALELEEKITDDDSRRVALQHRVGEVMADLVFDREAAVVQFLKILDHDPKHINTLASLATIYQALGRYDDLLDIYERQLEAMPNESDEPCKMARAALLFKLGELCQQRLADAERAGGFYERALTLDPEHGPLLRALAAKLYQNKEWPALVEVLKKQLCVFEDGSERASVAYLLGETLEVRLEKLDEAQAAYQRSLEIQSDYRPAVEGLLRVYTSTQNWRGAIAILALEAERAADPWMAASALLRAGEIWCDRLSDPQAAIACYERVLALQKSNLRALFALEALYREAAEWPKLAGIYAAQATVLQAPSARVAALEEMARLYELHGLANHDARLRTYQAMIEIAPENTKALSSVQQLAIASQNDALLADVDGRAARVERHPTVAASFYARLGLCLEGSDPPAAVVAYRSALQRDPENVAAIVGLGRAATVTCDYQAVVEALHRKARWTHDDELASVALSKSARIRLERLEDAPGALEDAESALERWPDSDDAAMTVAELLRRTGDVERLISRVKRAAGRASHPRRIQALWRQLAQLYASDRGDVGAGLAALKRMPEAGVREPATMLLLGELYERNKQAAQAVVAFQEALKLDPSSVQAVVALLALGRLFAYTRDDAEAAIASLSALLDFDAQHQQALTLLVELYQKTNNQKGRRGAFAALLPLAVEPIEQARIQIEIARIDIEDGRMADALNALCGAVAIEGPRGRAAELYRTLPGVDDAGAPYAAALIEHIKRTIEGELKDENLRQSYLELSRTQHDSLRQIDAAQRTLREGISVCGGDKLLHLELAQRLAADQQTDQAIAEFVALVAVDPTTTEGWRGLAAAYKVAGLKLEVAVASAPLVVLGKASKVEAGMARQRRADPGVAKADSFCAEALESISAGSEHDELRVAQLLRTISGGTGKLFSTDFESYGILSRHVLGEHPIRQTAKRLALCFGIETYEIYLHRSPSTEVVVELASTPALMVPGYMVDLPEPQQVFMLARAFALLTRGIHAAFTLGPSDLHRLVAAAVQGVAPGYASDRYPLQLLDSQYRQLSKALSRKARRALPDAARQFLSEPAIDLAAWCSTLELTSARAAALLCNDLPAAIEVIARSSPAHNRLEGATLVRRSPRVRDLLAFWPSAPAFQLRRSAEIL